MTLSDLQELMELTLGNSYFVYNRQIYLQLQGLFMGSSPAPPIAVTKMWATVRNSIYVDLRITLPFCSIFYDDLAKVTTNKRKAQQLINSIENADPDKLLKLTLDYPEKSGDYIPFLNTEVRITPDGTVDHRLFRKPQKKQLTLHADSHHATSTKRAVVVI